MQEKERREVKTERGRKENKIRGTGNELVRRNQGARRNWNWTWRKEHLFHPWDENSFQGVKGVVPSAFPWGVNESI